MKKYILLWLTILLIFLATACDNQISEPTPTANDTVEPQNTESEQPVSDPEPPSVGLSFTTIENKINESYIDYSEHYELISNLDNPKIRTHINQSIETTIESVKNNTFQIEKLLSDQTDNIPLKMTVRGRLLYSDDQILSYEIMNTSIKSDDEENIKYTFLNFDIETGQLIKLRDLISMDDFYEQIEKSYPKSYETPFNKESLWSFNLDQSFHLTGKNSAVFLFQPYELNYEQAQFIQMPLYNIRYNAFQKKMIGSTIRDVERMETTKDYDLFFVYPYFENSLDIYSDVNEDIEKHATEFYDYGTFMAIEDHLSQKSEIGADLSTEKTLSPDDNQVENSTENPSLETTENDTSSPESATIDSKEPEMNDNIQMDTVELAPYWFNLGYTIFTNNENILSFGLYDYQYTGGAHGLSTGNFYSYDLELGRRIELKDLFEPKFDYITYINDKIYRKIDQEAKENPESNYVYYDFSGIDENVKFYIEDNELVIFFDQYAIAAYAVGTPTFRIPLP